MSQIFHIENGQNDHDFLGNEASNFDLASSENPKIPSTSPETPYLTDKKGKKIPLTGKMQEKLEILRACGFTDLNDTVTATLLNLYPRNPRDKYRTKCFIREEDRVRAHYQVIMRSRAHTAQASPRECPRHNLSTLKDELDCKIYEPPVPLVPYPHRSKRVMPDGFERRESPTYASKVVQGYRRWLEKRGCTLESQNMPSVNSMCFSPKNKSHLAKDTTVEGQQVMWRKRALVVKTPVQASKGKDILFRFETEVSPGMVR